MFFVLNRSGFDSLLALVKLKAPVWVTAGVLSEQELTDMRAGGVDLTNFNYSLDADDIAGVEGALSTIREHHPGQTVWIGR